MQIVIPSVDQIIKTNQYVCNANGNFFSSPRPRSGVAKKAGALCYYLLMAHAFQDGNKRVGAITAVTFMKINGWKLIYPLEEFNGNTALANVILEWAAGRKTKDDLIEWFDKHKSEIA